MRIESAEQGVRFEWEGEPSAVVRVGLLGPRERNYERLELLQAVVREQRAGGVGWTDLELRERHFPGSGGRREPALLWSAQFPEWQTAAMVFTVLCRAVGLDDPEVRLDVTP